MLDSYAMDEEKKEWIVTARENYNVYSSVDVNANDVADIFPAYVRYRNLHGRWQKYAYPIDHINVRTFGEQQLRKLCESGKLLAYCCEYVEKPGGVVYFVFFVMPVSDVKFNIRQFYLYNLQELDANFVCNPMKVEFPSRLSLCVVRGDEGRCEICGCKFTYGLYILGHGNVCSNRDAACPQSNVMSSTLFAVTEHWFLKRSIRSVMQNLKKNIFRHSATPRALKAS